MPVVLVAILFKHKVGTLNPWELQMENKRKREETEARMAAVVDAQNEAKKQQELEMEEKHRISEAKRLAFEAKRNEELAAAKRASDAKAAHIHATIEQNDRREEAKKELYRRKEAEAQERLRLLTIEKQHEEVRKQQERDDKERARQAAIEKASNHHTSHVACFCQLATSAGLAD